MSTNCEMHGAVNYVTQEGLVCGECNQLVERKGECDTNHGILYRLQDDIWECQCNATFELKEIEEKEEEG